MPFNEDATPFTERPARAFESENETLAAMTDPRYASDPAYRGWVERCVAIGAPGTNNVTDTSKHQSFTVSHDAMMLAHDRQQLIEELKQLGATDAEIAKSLTEAAERDQVLTAEDEKYKDAPAHLRAAMLLGPAESVLPKATPFRTPAERTAAMQDERYRNLGPVGDTYRAEVARRIAVTPAFDRESVHGTVSPPQPQNAS